MKKQEDACQKTESRTAAIHDTVLWTEVAEFMALYCDLIRANPRCFVVAPNDQAYLDFCAVINTLRNQYPTFQVHWLNQPKRLRERKEGSMACVLLVEKLTNRQQEVLSYIKMGKSNKEIARSMGISEGTVKLHCSAIYEKLRVHNRTQAAAE